MPGGEQLPQYIGQYEQWPQVGHRICYENEGGEHIVYADGAGLMRKVSKVALQQHPHNEEVVEAMLQDTIARQAEQDLFLPDSRVDNTLVVREVYYDEPAQQYIWKHNAPSGRQPFFKTIVRFQPRSMMLDYPDSFISLTVPKVDLLRGFDRTRYTELNSALISRPWQVRKSDIDRLAGMQGGSWLPRVIEQAEHNRTFRESLGGFITQCIEYTRATGHILDLFGEMNAIIGYYGRFNGRIERLDTLIPINAKLGDLLSGALIAAQARQPIARMQASGVIHGGAYVRLVNLLSALLDLPDRLEMAPSTFPDEFWGTVFDQTRQHFAHLLHGRDEIPLTSAYLS